MSALSILLFLPALCAAAYPEKPVRLVVGLPAGSITDIAARMLAEQASKDWGATVIVENRPGAGGLVAMEYVARSAPDGHTLYVATPLATLYGLLRKEVAVDLDRDFTPVMMMYHGPLALVVKADSPYTSLREFVDYARLNPGKLNYASSGPGSVLLSMEWFAKMTGTKFTEIPYKGSGEFSTALLSGQVHVVLDSPLAYKSFISDGRTRALAVTGEQRSSALPSVPTTAEAGFPEFITGFWGGLLAPKGTPSEVVLKWEKAGQALGQNREAAVRFREGFGVEPALLGSSGFASFLRRQTELWRKVAADAGIRPE